MAAFQLYDECERPNSKRIKNARGHMSRAALGPQSTEKHLKPKRLSEKSQFYSLLWLRLTQTHSNSSSSADDVRTSLLIIGGKQDTYRWKRKMKLIKSIQQVDDSCADSSKSVDDGDDEDAELS